MELRYVGTGMIGFKSRDIFSLRYSYPMQVFQIYAAAAGGLFALIVVLQILRSLRGWVHEEFAPLLLKFLVYPFCLRRHRFLGPWTRLSALTQMLYWAATVFCALYKTSSMADINVRLGNLSLINAIPLYATVHLSALADALGMSLTAFRGLHGSVGFMTGALAAAHVGVSVNLKGAGSSQSLPKLFGYAVKFESILREPYLRMYRPPPP